MFQFFFIKNVFGRRIGLSIPFYRNDSFLHYILRQECTRDFQLIRNHVHFVSAREYQELFISSTLIYVMIFVEVQIYLDLAESLYNIYNFVGLLYSVICRFHS